MRGLIKWDFRFVQNYLLCDASLLCNLLASIFGLKIWLRTDDTCFLKTTTKAYPLSQYTQFMKDFFDLSRHFGHTGIELTDLVSIQPSVNTELVAA